MPVKYSRIFTVTGAITVEPVTILVEYLEAEGFRGISVESLEGDYTSAKEFGKASDRVIEESPNDDKIYNFLPLKLPDARQLMNSLSGALEASEVSFT